MDAFLALLAHSDVISSQDQNVEELVNRFNSSGSEILKVVAPYKTKKLKSNNQSWFNSDIKILRKKCRRAESQWKKDKLQISYQILQSNLSNFQEAVSLERAKYFSNIISKYSHCPNLLFSTLNSVLNPSRPAGPEPSLYLSEKFCNFFINKITEIRAQISSNLTQNCQYANICSSAFSYFQTISHSELLMPFLQSY